MLRLTTNGTDFMQELLSTENQYRTALSVLSSARATRDAALPELSDEEKLVAFTHSRARAARQ